MSAEPAEGALVAAAREAVACLHCGLQMEAGGSSYCCSGCEMAAAIISGAGLDRYYAERTAPAPRPGPATGGWEHQPVEVLEDGRHSIVLRVDGLTCAACVWVTERVLTSTPGVQEALVSHASGRARVCWDPQQVDLATIAGRISAIGYRPRAVADRATPDRSLVVRVGFAAFVAMNVMLMSASIYAGWFDGIEERHAALFRWISLALTTPAVVWAASPLYAAAIAGLRHRVLHMDLPVTLGIAAMYGHGLWATFTGRDAWLDSLTMLIALLLAGRLLEQRGRRNAADAASALAGVAPSTARRVVDGKVETVAASALATGDRLQLGAGEELAADGVVVSGEGLVRMAILTGESEPVAVAVGDRVVAGALLEEGALEVRVEAAGGETLVARMARQLAAAADRPAPPELTDRIAPWFTGAVLLLAGGAIVGWWLAKDLGTGAGIAMAVLVVACPCALALASPLATAAGLGAAARRGLLVRTGGALRSFQQIDLVALDKTGTLTTGEPAVVAGDDAVLRVASGLERYSVHPIARAVVAEAARRGIPLPRAEDVREEPGVGISGIVDGKRWSLGRGGPGEVLLTGEDGPVGTLRLKDTLREDAARTVAALRARGLRVALVSGDHAEVAEEIGRTAGVDEVVAGLSPEAKSAWVAARRAEGRRVLFAGDGVNDGPALAAADVAVAMGAGAASSVLVADAVVAREGLGPVLAGLRAADAARAAVRANTVRSIVYNVLAVSAALAGLVNPLVAAVLMPFSSALVIWGASRVERKVASA